MLTRREPQHAALCCTPHWAASQWGTITLNLDVNELIRKLTKESLACFDYPEDINIVAKGSTPNNEVVVRALSSPIMNLVIVWRHKQTFMVRDEIIHFFPLYDLKNLKKGENKSSKEVIFGIAMWAEANQRTTSVL
ncbi:hypothetical protein J6590_041194 [Homalodisca vitripennis]|nr:hypothetical protein J6590_041194 [Homalodisca vitripennis]